MEVKLFSSIEEAKNILRINEPRLVKANGRNICIVLKGEEIIAFRNECPHMGESLHRGNINYLGEIICPLHTYRFNLKTGEEASQKCRSLEFFRVIIKEEIFLEL